MKVINKKIKKEKNQKMATICLMLCLFFNPAGFDILFKTILDCTNSYWITTGIFYLIAGLFLGLSFYFSRTNPLVVIKEWIIDLFTKVKNLANKK